jgi:chorismate mutase
MNNNIANLRQKIDTLDNEISKLLIQRLHICKLVGEIKNQSNTNKANYKDQQREIDIINRLTQLTSCQHNEKALINIFKSIFTESLELQRNV